MSKLAAMCKHEFMEMLPPTIFFFVILHIVALVRTLMSEGTLPSWHTSGTVTIVALILGKSVLVANMLPFINCFPEKPLIWNAGWKTLIYTLVALVVHFLEHLYDYWKLSPSLVVAYHKQLTELNWAHFWAIQILLVTLILNYCVLAELSRIIGRQKFKAIFFGPMPTNPAGQATM
ncbi:hypothetical protein [Paraburkholderia sp. ZP32-5]|uniref:hypothetical protein n=1 Tax=Paraburkholderia sp. ZP32-5 TaxID=2883245 RepID=UPI001F475583|nr:hypothetical protein [Paraburkholderia sp. ZP32-5]